MRLASISPKSESFAEEAQMFSPSTCEDRKIILSRADPMLSNQTKGKQEQLQINHFTAAPNITKHHMSTPHDVSQF